jgi:hypothetical protein
MPGYNNEGDDLGVDNTAPDRLEAAAIALWHRMAPDYRMDWDEEPHKTEYRDAVRVVMEVVNGK